MTTSGVNVFNFGKLFVFIIVMNCNHKNTVTILVYLANEILLRRSVINGDLLQEYPP